MHGKPMQLVAKGLRNVSSTNSLSNWSPISNLNKSDHVQTIHLAQLLPLHWATCYELRTASISYLLKWQAFSRIGQVCASFTTFFQCFLLKFKSLHMSTSCA
jgi:hypothetical protein